MEYSHTYIEAEGHLHIPTSNRGGKKFQTWTFKPVNADSFDINVDLMYPDKGKPLRFRATSQKLTVPIESSNIQSLRDMVDHDLQNQCSIFNNIEWEEWYMVSVSGGHRPQDCSSTLVIKYTKIKKGIHPKTSEEVTMNFNKVIIPFPKTKGLGDETSKYNSAEGISYIKATEQNKFFLEDIVSKLNGLRDDIANYLDYKNITETISNNSVKKLLTQ